MGRCVVCACLCAGMRYVYKQMCGPWGGGWCVVHVRVCACLRALEEKLELRAQKFPFLLCKPTTLGSGHVSRGAPPPFN